MAGENTDVFDFESSGDILIVSPRGSLMEFRDEDIRNAYNDTYRKLDGPESTHLLIDFSKLTYFGSTFVGMLIRLAKKARNGGGEALLCNLSENMLQMMKQLMLLENTKTDFFWVPFESREAAIASLVQDTAESTEPPKADPPPEQSAGGWSRFVE